MKKIFYWAKLNEEGQYGIYKKSIKKKEKFHLLYKSLGNNSELNNIIDYLFCSILTSPVTEL